MSSSLRPVVDRETCFSFALCVESLPDVFVLDAEGKSVVREVDAPEHLLKDAVDGCPRSAISLVASDGSVFYP